MTVYSYVIEHDFGFAPNPFHGLCTLATCKPIIRRVAKVGDFIIGTGSTRNGLSNHMLYWMEVDEVTRFDRYWHDPRFRLKRPDMRSNGRIHRYGDNIYQRDDATGRYIQADSYHSRADGSVHQANYERDTGSTDKVLVGRRYAYFGKAAPEIPEGLRDLIKKGPGHKSKFAADRMHAFKSWAQSQGVRKWVGDPSDW